MTKIEWCDITLNPIVGCSKCSPGCANCYAEKFAAMLAKNPNPKIAAKYKDVVDEHGRWTGEIFIDTSFLTNCALLKKKSTSRKNRKVFVGSMCDLFNLDAYARYDSNNQVRSTKYVFWNLWNYFAKNPQNTFILLTKHPEGIGKVFDIMLKTWPQYTKQTWPFPNVWLGVTVCNQAEADEKLPILMKIPAAKRFVSVEPMLGPVDLLPHIFSEPTGKMRTMHGHRQMELVKPDDGGIHWIICGGETGPGARPMHSDWVKSLRDQCIEAGVPFFFKSWGDWWPCTQMPDDFDCSKYPYGDIGDDGIFIPPPALEIPFRNGVCHEQVFKVGKKLSGHLIDGEAYREFPEA